MTTPHNKNSIIDIQNNDVDYSNRISIVQNTSAVGEIDHLRLQKMHMANAHDQLDDFSIYIADLLKERINSIGMPIGDKINSQNVFDFHIHLLIKYKPT